MQHDSPSFCSSGFCHDRAVKVNSSRLDALTGCWWRKRPCLLQLPSRNLPAVYFIMTPAHLLLEHQQLAGAKVWSWHPSLLPRTPVAPMPPHSPIHPFSSSPFISQPSHSVFICSSSWRLQNAKPCARWLLFWLVVCFFSKDKKPQRQIRLTAITGEQRRGGFSEPSAISAPELLLSFTQLVKIFYCTCASNVARLHRAGKQLRFNVSPASPTAERDPLKKTHALLAATTVI